MNNITWQHPNSKGGRNEDIYARFWELMKTAETKDEAYRILAGEHKLSSGRITKIVKSVEKKINKLKK